jgi:chromosome segregation ATPase
MQKSFTKYVNKATSLALALILSVGLATATTTSTTSYQQKREELKERREQFQGEMKEKREEFRGEMKEKKQEIKDAMTGARCENILKRVENRVDRYNANHEQREKEVLEATQRLSEVSARLKAAGLDTAALDSQLAILKTKKEKLLADKAAFINQLLEAKKNVCGKSEGVFKAEMQKAQELQKVVVADVKDVHDYMKNTVRKTIADLRTQAKNLKATSTNSN